MLRSPFGRLWIAFWLVIPAFFYEPAIGSHHVELPLVPDTPAIHNLWQDGEWTWCLDSRASVYPNFRSQVVATFAEYKRVLGISSREAWPDCDIWITMPDGNFCDGCAANVSYANWPVIQRYKWSLGFVYWNGTIGHETGHVGGLHEQYIDFGSIQCTKRTDTVMDCGSHITLPPLGVWFPQEFDWKNLLMWLYPPPVDEAGLAYHEGRPFAWYCGGDPHPARANQTAIMYLDPNGAFYWSGIMTPVARGGDGCIRQYVYCYPGRQFYVNQQISGWPAASQIWYLRNDVLAGTCT